MKQIRNPNAGRGGKERTVYFAYTILFFLTAAFLCSIFLRAGKDLVWKVDGIFQHYNAYIYIGVYFRQAIRGLLFHHSLSLPMWSDSIGYGGDILTTLTYYGFADPFTWTSILVPVKYSEAVYCVMTLVRLYLSGVNFILFSRQMKCSGRGAACGAAAYAYCGFAVQCCLRHPFFANALFWLPLVLFCMERILRGASPVAYMITIAFAAAGNFYFFYMIAIFAFFFGLLRDWDLTGGAWKKMLRDFCRLLAWSLAGAAAAGVILLPVVFAVLGSTRGDNGYLFNSVPDLKSIIWRLESLMTYSIYFGRKNFYAGAAPIILAGVLTDFIGRRGAKWARRLMALNLIFLFIPACAYTLNGFGYVSYRWCFGFAFTACFLFAENADALFRLRPAEKIILAGICTAYAGTCLILDPKNQDFRISAAGLLILVILLLPPWQKLKPRRGEKGENCLRAAGALCLAAAVLAGNFANIYTLCAPSMGNAIEDFRPAGEGKTELYGRFYPLVRSLPDRDRDFFRVEIGNAPEMNLNMPLSSGVSSTGVFWSMLPEETGDFMKNNAVYTEELDRFRGLQSRAWLLPLAGVRYFAANRWISYSAPYGFRLLSSRPIRIDGSRKTGLLYQTDDALPLGYTYDEIIDYGDYRKMSFAEKQQAMLQGAVIREEDLDGTAELPEARPVFNDRELKKRVIAADGAEMKDNTIITHNKHATLTFRTSCPARRELYLELTGLRFIRADGKISDTAFFARSSRARSASFTHFCPTATYTSGRTDYLMNLYSSDQTRKTVTLDLAKPGTYHFDSLRLISQDLSGIRPAVRKLSRESLRHVRRSGDRIRGDITVSKRKILVFSIPWSKGWTVYVDGKKGRLVRANDMFMATVLSPGHHRIQLRYRTPGLIPGALLSAAGILLILIIWRKHR